MRSGLTPGGLAGLFQLGFKALKDRGKGGSDSISTATLYKAASMRDMETGPVIVLAVQSHGD